MKIVTDCAADMPNEELERLGVVQAPLFIQFPEGEVNAGHSGTRPKGRGPGIQLRRMCL